MQTAMCKICRCSQKLLERAMHASQYSGDCLGCKMAGSRRVLSCEAAASFLELMALCEKFPDKDAEVKEAPWLSLIGL